MGRHFTSMNDWRVMTDFSSRAKWLATLPHKRSASGALFFNSAGEILILEPLLQVYSQGWVIPGGMVENNESPREAAKREAQEEIGLDVTIGRLLCLDYMPHHVDDVTQDSYQIIFDGSVLTDAQIAAMRLKNDEIAGYRFVEPSSAIDLLRQSLAPRVKMALQARSENTVYYLEHTETI